MGDWLGESGLLFLDVDPVRGLSPVPLPLDTPLACRKALRINVLRGPSAAAALPKDVDVSPTNLASEVD